MKIHDVIKKANSHVMVFGEIPDFSSMDSVQKKSVGNGLVSYSANVSYDALGTYVNDASCVLKPTNFEIGTIEHNQAILDSMDFHALIK